MPRSFFSPPLRFLSGLAFASLPLAASAAVIGTNPPAPPLSPERIAPLPAAQQTAWRDYLTRSQRALAADTKFYAGEIKAAGLTEALVPPKGSGPSLKEPAAFYASAEARRIAENVVSFQTPAGGWNKNTDFAAHPRRPGERSGYEAGYVGTFDNDATMTPLAFLARVISAGNADRPEASPLRASFQRGIEYILGAQFPNGGWPQVWPLEGGYHDMITFNDGAIINLLTLLREVAGGNAPYAFVASDLRARAAASITRGVDCILATQIVFGGRRTVWCQQHDPFTLTPASARNYEMPSQSSSESAGIMIYLMAIPNPSPAVVASVRAAAAWFQKTALHDVTFNTAPGETDRQLHHVAGSPALWPRYAEIGSDRPLFGDRDKTIHDNVDEISAERRNGYAWFNTHPTRALALFEKWNAQR